VQSRAYGNLYHFASLYKFPPQFIPVKTGAGMDGKQINSSINIRPINIRKKKIPKIYPRP